MRPDPGGMGEFPKGGVRARPKLSASLVNLLLSALSKLAGMNLGPQLPSSRHKDREPQFPRARSCGHCSRGPTDRHQWFGQEPSRRSVHVRQGLGGGGRRGQLKLEPPGRDPTVVSTQHPPPRQRTGGRLESPWGPPCSMVMTSLPSHHGLWICGRSRPRLCPPSSPKRLGGGTLLSTLGLRHFQDPAHRPLEDPHPLRVSPFVPRS